MGAKTSLEFGARSGSLPALKSLKSGHPFVQCVPKPLPGIVMLNVLIFKTIRASELLKSWRGS